MTTLDYLIRAGIILLAILAFGFALLKKSTVAKTICIVLVSVFLFIFFIFLIDHFIGVLPNSPFVSELYSAFGLHDVVYTEVATLPDTPVTDAPVASTMVATLSRLTYLLLVCSLISSLVALICKKEHAKAIIAFSIISLVSFYFGLFSGGYISPVCVGIMLHVSCFVAFPRGYIKSLAKSPTPKNTNNKIDELNELKALLDMGAISQEEFDAKKKDILGL